MICRYCGVDTREHAEHETQQACIAALRAEIASLRNVLRHTTRPHESLLSVGDRLEALPPERR